MTPNILSISGADPTGVAGVQSDIKTFAALDTYGYSAVTAVVAGSSRGVRSYVALDPDFVELQITSIFEDVQIDAVKIGMVANAGIIEAIARTLRRYPYVPIVLDPVMVTKNGDHLLDPESLLVLRDELVPMATLITPNLPEAQVLTSGETMAANLNQMRELVDQLKDLGPTWVLLKGGLLSGPECIDLLAGPTSGQNEDAPRVVALRTARIDSSGVYGAGSILAAATTALLTRHKVVCAATLAKEFVTLSIENSPPQRSGVGFSPVRHCTDGWNALPDYFTTPDPGNTQTWPMMLQG